VRTEPKKTSIRVNPEGREEEEKGLRGLLNIRDLDLKKFAVREA
jgi:hypothetical protein